MPPATDLVSVVRDVTFNAFLFDAARYGIAAVLMAAIVWALGFTAWRSRRIQSRKARAADYRREILSSIQSVAVYTAVTVLTVWMFRNGWMARWEGEVTLLGFFGMLAAILVAHDAYFYWTHRAMHHPRLFKTFHRHHHKSTTPTPFAAYAFAVPEALVMTLFMPLWLALVPTPEPVIFVFLAVMIVRNVMGHAGLELHPRGWASHPVLKWISTTTHHDMHHCGRFDRNFGFYFTFWDKLMGTEHPDYVQRFNEVTTPGPKGDVPALSPAPVMAGFAALVLGAAAVGWTV